MPDGPDPHDAPDAALATGSASLSRRRIGRDCLAVGVGTGMYGIAFGAAAATKGFSAPQAGALSSLMFTGGSQFALVTVRGAGGSIAAALGVAWMLGARNGLYALRLSSVLPERLGRRLGAAHLVIDESMAMSVTRPAPDLARFAFWVTGVSVFVFWNLATIVGALVAGQIADPNAFGLDAAFPAAFLALIWPQLRGRSALSTAACAAVISLVLIPLAPAGLPIVAASTAVVVGVAVARRGVVT